MIILTIFNPDKSVYWREHFNDMESCELWLHEEKTRSYWNPAFSYLIEDKRPTLEEISQIQQQIEAELTKKEQRKTLVKTKLTALGLTEEEIEEILGL